MTAVAVTPKSAATPIRLSSLRAPDLREIVHSNAMLVKVLGKRSIAEIDVQAVPDQLNDLYRRRVNVIKYPLRPGEVNPPADEMVTLEDLALTDLPWFGYITANPYGSRQFRSRNALLGSVEVVREIDGFLYSLNCDVGRDLPPINPALIEVEGPTRRDTAYKLTARKPKDAAEMLAEFGHAAMVPDTLFHELTSLGYVLNGTKFTLPGNDNPATSILVHLYGKIVTPI